MVTDPKLEQDALRWLLTLEPRAPHEQRSELARLHQDAPALADRVRQLLYELTVSGPGAPSGSSSALFSEPQRPLYLGPFEVGEELGRGGMGAVYRGIRRDSGFAQEVALKTLRPLGTSPETIQRFLRERRILAQLTHPHIATFIDGGATEAGLLWFAMELVRGRAITDYADQHSLSVRERIALCTQVTDAVAFAHRALVIHRDLKPSNVFVADGQVKLLDFGIAKLLEDPDDDLTHTTAPFTPRYAAPEQRLNQPSTTATDVFQIGGLLQELLSGIKPQAEYLPMSVRLRQDTPALGRSNVHLSRKLPSNERLAEILRGDLDAIVGKALASDPGERYLTAAEFGEDLRRVLSSRPVLARPASRWYVLRRMVARNRLATATTSLALFAVLAGSSVAWIAGNRAEREAERATLSLQRAQNLKNLLLQTFSDADPIWSTSSANDVPGVLAALAARVGGAQDLPVGDQIDLLLDIGRSLDSFDRGAQAAPVFERALSLARANPSSERVGIALATLGGNLFNRSQYQQAESMYSEAEPILRAQSPPDPSSLGLLLAQQATFAQTKRDFVRAEALSREAIKWYEQSPQGPGGRGATQARIDLSRALAHTQTPDAAILVLESARALRQASVGTRADPMLATLSTNLCFMYDMAQRIDQASACQQHADAFVKQFPTDLWGMGEALDAAARLLRRAQRLDEALAYFERALAIEANNPEAESSQVFLINEICQTLVAKGDFSTAEARQRPVIAKLERLHGLAHQRTMRGKVQLAQALLGLGRRDEARALVTPLLPNLREQRSYLLEWAEQVLSGAVIAAVPQTR